MTYIGDGGEKRYGLFEKESQNEFGWFTTQMEAARMAKFMGVRGGAFNGFTPLFVARTHDKVLETEES